MPFACKKEAQTYKDMHNESCESAHNRNVFFLVLNSAKTLQIRQCAQQFHPLDPAGYPELEQIKAFLSNVVLIRRLYST